MKEIKEVTKKIIDTNIEIDNAFTNVVYDVKKEQLTFTEYGEYLRNVIDSVVDYEHKEIMHSSLETSLKLFFAIYYLDIDMSNDDVDNGGYLSEINYAKYCNINFKDYMNKIAYNQFLSLLKSIDSELASIEKRFAPTIENLIKSATKYVDSMSNTFGDIDIEEVLRIFGQDSIANLPDVIAGIQASMSIDKDNTVNKKEETNKDN